MIAGCRRTSPSTYTLIVLAALWAVGGISWLAWTWVPDDWIVSLKIRDNENRGDMPVHPDSVGCALFDNALMLFYATAPDSGGKDFSRCLGPRWLLYIGVFQDGLGRYYVLDASWVSLCILIALVLLISTGVALHWRRTQRLSSHHCRVCGYNLRGNTSGRCSECGTVNGQVMPVDRRSGRRRRGGAGRPEHPAGRAEHV